MNSTMIAASEPDAEGETKAQKAERLRAEMAALQSQLNATMPSRDEQQLHESEQQKARDHASRDEPVPGSREEQQRKEAAEQHARDWATRG